MNIVREEIGYLNVDQVQRLREIEATRLASTICHDAPFEKVKANELAQIEIAAEVQTLFGIDDMREWSMSPASGVVFYEEYD